MADKNSGADKDSLLANVALLYYGEGLTQSEIAQRMGVSRPTIVNMLRDSRERGIVEIRVDGKVLTSSTLSRQLCEKFGLQDVYVARSRASGSTLPDRTETLTHVANVAAVALLNIVKDGDTVGVAWGETIKAVASVMPHGQARNVTVCQMIGSMVSERVPASEDCAIRIANALNAQCFTLHAPAVMSSVELAQAMRNEMTIAAQLKRLESLDVALFSIGNTDADTHLVAASIASKREVKAAVRAGAKGIVCCRYIDDSGQQMDLPPDDRVIAISTETLKRARRKLVVIAGEDRRDAALAILSGGLATHLCVDEHLARTLLQSD